jgi:hypothetical protein
LKRLIRAAAYSAHGRRSQTISNAVLFVKPLRQDDIRVFVNQFVADGPKIWGRMQSLVDLNDLATRPILLPMVCESLREVDARLAEGHLTAGYLYRLYVDLWLSRESRRLGFGEAGAMHFLEDLPLWFHNENRDSIPFDAFVTWFPEFFPTQILSAERERVVGSLQLSTVLSNDAAGNYGFVHRSFFEYFLAERIVRAIRSGDSKTGLTRFPSKVTDGFVIDILGMESGWREHLLDLMGSGSGNVMRYLCVYLANRLAKQPDSTISTAAVMHTVSARLSAELDPVVMRELLVTLAEHGLTIPDDILWKHLRNPIPAETIRQELKDYYGSLEEARLYLRHRLRPDRPTCLRLFYLISLAAIISEADMPIFRHYARAGDAFEATVTTQAIEELARGAGLPLC